MNASDCRVGSCSRVLTPVRFTLVVHSMRISSSRVAYRMKYLQLLPLMAHVLAWAAFLGVVFWPLGYSETNRTTLPDGSMRAVFGHSPGPFRLYLGPEDVMLLLIPVALTGLAVWLAWSRSACSTWTKLAQWGLGALCLVYCSVPLLFVPEVDISFIGVFFLLATLVLIVSAITAALRAKLREKGEPLHSICS